MRIKPRDCNVELGGFSIKAKCFGVNARFLVVIAWSGFSGCAPRLAKTILWVNSPTPKDCNCF